MKRKIDYSLYLVTDRILMSTSTLEEAIEQAMIGGCTLIQLREKEVSSLEFYHTAMKVKRITEQYNVPLVINDRVDIALAIEADGIHIGQSDLPASAVRRIIGKNKLLGVSVSSVEEAHKAMMDGADYLGVGAMFSTGTKIDAKLVSMEELKKIKNEVKLPIVAIGGINQNTVPEFKSVGIDGIAVVSAIIAEQNIVAAAQKMRTLFFDL